jgi:hypothetical protein
VFELKLVAGFQVELMPTAANGSVWIFKQGHKPQLVPDADYTF